ncbi:MAG: hypothetical protein GY906_27065, partial [bacterium]|nr:hypothetical protein [bacterium]
MIGLGITDVRLCLDFINTEGVERNDPPDRLDSLDSFLEWAARYGLSDEEDTAILNREAPEKASGEMPGEAVLARARTLREALYRIITAVT